MRSIFNDTIKTDTNTFKNIYAHGIHSVCIVYVTSGASSFRICTIGNNDNHMQTDTDNDIDVGDERLLL